MLGLMVGDVRILYKEVFGEEHKRKPINEPPVHPTFIDLNHTMENGMMMNIDNTRGNARPVHSVLLASDILIMEHLCNLKRLPDEGFTVIAIPPKIKGMGTFPVRAMAKVSKGSH